MHISVKTIGNSQKDGNSSKQGGVLDKHRTVPDLSHKNILLVEDNLTNQLIATKILEKTGANVVIADNGEEALQCLHQGQFDLVLMDVQMPVLDGLQTTQAIRNNPQWRLMPVIAMTASVLDCDIDKCLAIGMNEHVAKPIDIPAFYNLLDRWLLPRSV